MTQRKDSKGKRALFETPPIVIEEAAADVSDPETTVGGDDAGASVSCSACRVTTHLTRVELGIRVLAISLWIPGRDFSRYMQCPSCQTRTWCRVEWFA